MTTHRLIRNVACTIVASLLMAGLNVAGAVETSAPRTPVPSVSDAGLEKISSLLTPEDEGKVSAEFFSPSFMSPTGGNVAEPNAIIDADDRRKVSDTTRFPYSAVVLFFDAHQNPACSGSLIGPDTVLTAAHCLISEDQQIKSGYTFCPGVHTTGSKSDWGGSGGGWGSSSVKQPRGAMSAEESSTNPIDLAAPSSEYEKPFGCTDATAVWWDRGYKTDSLRHDIALVHLRKPLGNKAGYFGFTSKFKNGSKVYVTGYPDDKGMRTQWTHWTNNSLLKDGTLRYDVDTFRGQSGSPVYGDEYRVYAAHSGYMGAYGRNSGVPITDDRIFLFNRYAREGGW